ncbi:MAG: cytochrome c biogenesis protein ResB [Propionibacteriaceae bacterium]|nr:cytochrome c biogenesis protein ResB [Propionibacteriaceae bacterium]
MNDQPSTKRRTPRKPGPTTEAEVGELAAELADNQPAQEAVSLPDIEETPEVSVRQFFGRLYQVTYSKTVGVILILLLTLYALIGILVTQAQGVMGDPAEKEEFLFSMEQKYGGFASILNALGLFHVFTSIGFFIVLGALVVSILGCTTYRIPGLWQRFRHPKVAVSREFFTKTRYRAHVDAPGASAATMDVAAQKMKARHYRVIRQGDNALFADKNSWGPLGTVLAHLAFIIIIGAFILTSLFTFEQRLNLHAGAGQEVALNKLDDVTIEAVSFEAPYTWEKKTDKEGNEGLVQKYSDYVSHLVVRKGGEVVAEKKDVRVNSPLKYGGYSFHQMHHGRTIDFSVSIDGQVVHSGPVRQTTDPQDPLNFDWFGSEERGGPAIAGSVDFVTFDTPITIGDQSDVKELLAPISVGMLIPAFSDLENPSLPEGTGVYFIVHYDGMGQPVSNATGMVELGQTSEPTSIVFEFDNGSKQGMVEITFHGDGTFTGIDMRKDPGALWMLIGSLLLIIGMLMTFMFRHRRIWMRAEEGTLFLASADKKDSGFTREFEDITKQARTWLTNSRNPS